MTPSDGHYPYVGDDPARIELAGSELGHVGRTFATLAGEVEHDTRSIREHWRKGHTGELAAADAARMGEALDECHLVFAQADRALSVLYPVLVRGRRQVDDLNHAYMVMAGPTNSYDGVLAAAFPALARPQQLLVAEDRLRAARASTGYDSLGEIDRAYARVHLQVSEETTICDDLLGRLAEQASGMPGHASGGKTRYDVSFGLLFEANQVAGILDGSVRFPTDAPGVHAAWLQLSEEQRAELRGARPLWFGNLNGIPAADRNTANRATLKAQMDRLSAGLKAAGFAPTEDPIGLDGLADIQISRLEVLCGLTLREAKQALLLNRQLLRIGKKGAQLLAYEPDVYGGKGRAAIAYGDLDKADNIAFCVPGLMSRLDNVKDVASDAFHLYDQALHADRFRHTAVVAWQGYDAPNFGQVAFQDAAEAGAKLLAADVNAMRITHEGAIRTLTVVGHSYGSTTTGLALQHEGLKVDQVALIGSPGVGGTARTVTDLHLDASRVFVGSASKDLITTLPDSLGEDPSEEVFGATRFKAESVQRGTGTNLDDHSRYYDALNQSESLYTLADIVTGHGDRLGTDGMLAQPRYIETGGAFTGLAPEPMVDPEADRTPTVGHDHANDPLYALRRPGS